MTTLTKVQRQERHSSSRRRGEGGTLLSPGPSFVHPRCMSPLEISPSLKMHAKGAFHPPLLVASTALCATGEIEHSLPPIYLHCLPSYGETEYT